MAGKFARYMLLTVAISAIAAQSASAQMRLASVILPTDSSNAKKTAVPLTAPAATAKATGFANNQLQNSRVVAARLDKRMELKQLFRNRGIAYPAAEIFMRIFKREAQLEIWVRPEGQDSFVLLKSYSICALTEKPGPKRNRGDLQTPEGFYYINDFNPQSGYHLSLKVNYPNESDIILGHKADMGGDVFIHGGCKTAGCMAMTDDNIKEIYWLSVEARDHGQSQIPVHIFPTRLSNNNLEQYKNVFGANSELIRFWTNIKRGYDLFEETHKLTAVTVGKNGRYLFGNEPEAPLLGKPAVAAAATQN